MSSIGALCDRLGMTFLKFLLGNLGATGGLRVNSSPAYNLSFVPADESAILPMTAKEACACFASPLQRTPEQLSGTSKWSKFGCRGP
jgi:hypothetical protein